MMPRVLAALVAFILSVTHAHMTASLGGMAVSVSVPWVLVVLLATGVAVFIVLVVRHLLNFRSSPNFRTVVAT